MICCEHVEVDKQKGRIDIYNVVNAILLETIPGEIRFAVHSRSPRARATTTWSLPWSTSRALRRSGRVTNAISGTTSGALSLNQIARGGFAGVGIGGGTAGAAGNASSTLVLSNTNAGSLSGSVSAVGGSWGSTGGDATAAISLLGLHNVTVSATAQGGGLAPGGAKSGVLQTVYGESLGGGTVTVSGNANGGFGLDMAGGVAADGANAILNNAVDAIPAAR